VDVALIHGGNVEVYLELKQTLTGCMSDLRKKLTNWTAPRWAVNLEDETL
jgi:hypothetical protein